MFQTPTETKKRDKKRKKSKGCEDRSSVKSETPVPSLPELATSTNSNNSTEESGYESDLTRRGSDKGSDSSLSNSPLSNRSLKLDCEDNSSGGTMSGCHGGGQSNKDSSSNSSDANKDTDLCSTSDLEQQDLSLDSITTTNETAVLQHLPTKLSDLVDVCNIDEVMKSSDEEDAIRKSKSLLNFCTADLTINYLKQSASLTNLTNLESNLDEESHQIIDTTDTHSTVSLIDINFNQTDEEKMRRSGKISVNTITTNNNNNNPSNDDNKNVDDNSKSTNNCEMCESHKSNDDALRLNEKKGGETTTAINMGTTATTDRQTSALIPINSDNLSTRMSNGLIVSCSNCALKNQRNGNNTSSSPLLHFDQQKINIKKSAKHDDNQLIIEDLEDKAKISDDDEEIDGEPLAVVNKPPGGATHGSAHLQLHRALSTAIEIRSGKLTTTTACQGVLISAEECVDNVASVELVEDVPTDSTPTTTNLEITNLRDTKMLQIHKLPESKTRQRFIIEGMVENGAAAAEKGSREEVVVRGDDNPSSSTVLNASYSSISNQHNHHQPCDNITSLCVEWDFNNFQSLPCTSLESAVQISGPTNNANANNNNLSEDDTELSGHNTDVVSKVQIDQVKTLESEIQRLRNELGGGRSEVVTGAVIGQKSASNNESAVGGRDLARLSGEAHETSLPLDFGDTLAPKHSNLINKQFRYVIHMSGLGSRASAKINSQILPNMQIVIQGKVS